MKSLSRDIRGIACSARALVVGLGVGLLAAGPSLAAYPALKVGVTSGPHAQIFEAAKRVFETEFKGGILAAW